MLLKNGVLYAVYANKICERTSVSFVARGLFYNFNFRERGAAAMPKARNPLVAEAEDLFRKGWKLVDEWDDERLPKRSEKNSERFKKNNERSEKTKSRKKQVVAKEVEQVINSPELTDKQRLFCIYYIRSFNATKAYQKAYECSYENAVTNGSRLLGNDRIQGEIRNLKQNRLNREFLSEEDIFQKYMDIAFADITDFVEFDCTEQPVIGAFGPVTNKDPETGEEIPVTAMVNAVRIKSSSDVDGTLISEISQGKGGIKIKLADRMKAIEWLADHMNLATEEQRAKIDNLKASTVKIKGEDPEDETEDSGFLEALKGAAKDAWED